MSFNFDLGNVTRQLNNGNSDLNTACVGCSGDFGPETVADPGLPALKPNVAIIIIGLGFTLILVAAFALFAKFMRPHLSRQDAGTRMWEDVVKDGHLLDTNVIKNLPLVVYSSESFLGMNLDSECAVCLSPFEEKEELRLLPNCKHMFHPSCIDNWLRSHPSCPLCRSTIVSSSWTLRNPLGTAGAGAAATSSNPDGTAAVGAVDGVVGPSVDDLHSHRVEITLETSQPELEVLRARGGGVETRAFSQYGGMSNFNNGTERDNRDAAPSTSTRVDVHEFEPPGGQSNMSAHSVFIFIPQTLSEGAAGSMEIESPSASLGGRSAISRLHEEVRSTLEASGSLKSMSAMMFGSISLRAYDDDSSYARNGACTGDSQ